MTETPPSPPPPYLLLGELVRPHGVRGEIRMRVMTDYPERMRELEYLTIAEDEDGTKARRYELESMRMHQNYALLKLRGIDDRDAADLLRQLVVLVELERAVPLEEGEFYLFQIIGMKVVTDDGELIGTVREVMETGANDVYIVDSERYGEVLLPVIPDIVLKTDAASATIIVHLMDGLLPKT